VRKRRRENLDNKYRKISLDKGGIMFLRIFSLVRFTLTVILLGASAWYGFATLSKTQTQAAKTVAPTDELIGALKDNQISLEKYRLFNQEEQLDVMLSNLKVAENELANFARAGQFKKQSINSMIDTSRLLIKSSKEMMANLKTLQAENKDEEELSKASLSLIGNLRPQLEIAANLASYLRQSSIKENDAIRANVLKQLKGKLFLVLIIVVILYLIEIGLSFLLKAKKRPEPVKTSTAVPVVTQSPKVGDMMLLNQKFQRIEETVEDMGERISLMAFNALLESARAGEAGKGFKIVAEELKRLADRSIQSAGNVKKILEESSDLLSDADTVKS